MLQSMIKNLIQPSRFSKSDNSSQQEEVFTVADIAVNVSAGEQAWLGVFTTAQFYHNFSSSFVACNDYRKPTIEKSPPKVTVTLEFGGTDENGAGVWLLTRLRLWSSNTGIFSSCRPANWT
jgi:hypothetical protein